MCKVGGRVISSASNQPLKGARVQLKNIDDPKSFYNLTTDADGQFNFLQVRPGTYRLLVRHNRFVPGFYGQRTAEFGPGAPLTLKAGDEVTDLLFKLIPTGAIEGQIVDEEDEPLPGIEIQALVRASQVPSDETIPSTGDLVPIRTAVTNDLGQFRLYDLAPGSYFVSAIDSGMPELSDESLRSGFGYELADSPQPKYPPTYYPGTTESSQAAKLELHAGEVTHIDLRLRRVETYQVIGRVVDLNHHPVLGANVSISLKDLATQFSSLRYGGETDAAGRFQITGVASGNYSIDASMIQDQKQWVAEEDINVSADNLKGVELVLLPPLTISGHIDFQSSSFHQGGRKIVWLHPKSGGNSHFGAGEISIDHTFKVEGLIPGAYSVSVSPLASDSYLAAAHLGSTDVLQNGLVLTGPLSSGTLELSISPDGASIEGLVTKSLKPVSGADVHIDRSDAEAGRGPSMTDAETDQNGNFAFHALPPGDYIVSVTESEHSDPAQKVTFTLEKKQHKKVTLELEEGQQIEPKERQ